MSAFKHVVRTEGPLALYKGFGTSALGLIVGPVYITGLETSKSTIKRWNGEHRFVPDDSPLIPMLAGGIGSVGGQTVAVPLDVVSQRVQMEEGRVSVVGLVRRLGLSGLYRGFFASCLQYVPSSMVTWGTFDFLSTHIRRACVGRRAPGALTDSVGHWAFDTALCAFAGGLAGTVTAVVTCPLDVVRTRLQVLGEPGGPRQSFAQVVAEVARLQGLRGFYSGVFARVATLGPLMACIMSGYEGLKRVCAKPGVI